MTKVTQSEKDLQEALQLQLDGNLALAKELQAAKDNTATLEAHIRKQSASIKQLEDSVVFQSNRYDMLFDVHTAHLRQSTSNFAKHQADLNTANKNYSDVSAVSDQFQTDRDMLSSQVQSLIQQITGMKRESVATRAGLEIAVFILSSNEYDFWNTADISGVRNGLIKVIEGEYNAKQFGEYIEGELHIPMVSSSGFLFTKPEAKPKAEKVSKKIELPKEALQLETLLDESL